MAEINIFDLEPTTISRDLKGKYLCIYGKPKSGKTTFAVQAPRNLLVAFEKGFNALANIKAQTITSWVDFKKLMKQLETERAREMYDTISLDTVGIMWDLCEQFVCIQNDVKKINDVPWGGGYKACREEFDKALRNLAMWGYGVIIIAHADIKTEKDAKSGEDFEIIGPSIPSRAYAIVNQMVDIIGYVSMEFDADENSTRWLYTRSTPRVMAGSRFAHLPPKIPFTYEAVTTALAQAIEDAGAIDGATIVDKETVVVTIKKDFALVKKEAFEVWNTLIERDKNNAEVLGNIIEGVFGSRVKLSEVPLSQQDLFELVLDEMKALL